VSHQLEPSSSVLNDIERNPGSFDAVTADPSNCGALKALGLMLEQEHADLQRIL
jgi:hypothetical protein